MGIPRYAAKKDTTQQSIIEAIRKAGYTVYILSLPVDLLIRHDSWPPSVFVMIESKTPNRKGGGYAADKRQKSQIQFCKDTGTQYITTPEEALEWLIALHKRLSGSR